MIDFQQLDLNLFRVFDAVLRTGSVTEAATKLHLTQPAVSNAIARLREQLDDPLFLRSGRRIVPTPYARQIADEVSQALSHLEEATQRGGGFDPLTSKRHFTLGMAIMLEATVLPMLVAALVDKAPLLDLTTVQIDSKFEQGLRSAAVDIVIDLPKSTSPDIRERSLAAVPLCVVMRKNHPLTKKALTVARWAKARHVVVQPHEDQSLLGDLELKRLGLERHVAVTCQHYYAACQVAAVSDLLVTLPRHYAKVAQATLPLTICPMPMPVPPIDVAMYWHRSADKDTGHAWLRALLETLAQQFIAQKMRIT